VLTRIVLWWSVFTSFTGLARNYTELLPIRFLFGAGEAGAYPNMAASISRWFPMNERAGAPGLVWMASRVWGAVSPFLVIPIQMAFGWRASFYLVKGRGFTETGCCLPPCPLFWAWWPLAPEDF
jgi:ACS family glucarate transporter-like MFS transporter